MEKGRDDIGGGGWGWERGVVDIVGELVMGIRGRGEGFGVYKGGWG